MCQWTTETIEDLHYLIEMKNLENPIYAASKKKAGVSHIVPISGLVITELMRLENEHKTVMELRETSEADCPGIDHLALQLAITKQQYKTTEAFMNEIHNGKRFDVNWQDKKNRWTVLHCATFEGQLNLCKELLKIPNIDVKIKNKDGNTALHYLAKYRPKDEAEQSLQIKLVKKLLIKGAAVSLLNLSGESPLHTACLRDNVLQVQLHLE